MIIQATDIVMVLSGGSDNTDPNKSLGGDPSSMIILNGVNNLFADVTQEQAAAGRVDYRCLYVFNDHPTDVFKSVQIWMEEVASGSDAILGLTVQDDIQVITVTGTPTGGSFILDKDGNQVTCAFDSNISIFGSNIQNAINTLPGITDAIVAASPFPNASTFQVMFQGEDGHRFQSTMTIAANNLTGPGSISVVVTKLISGGPINSTTPLLDVPTTTPPGVTFVRSSSEERIDIGNLRPADGFPVWVRRTTVAGSSPASGDGFNFVVEGDPIQ